MKRHLDELIIVNPGSAPPPTSWFLGADGGLYRLDHAAASRKSGEPALDEAAFGDAGTVPRFFLGDDGILYETR